MLSQSYTNVADSLGAARKFSSSAMRLGNCFENNYVNCKRAPRSGFGSRRRRGGIIS
jgi:hypothetical protein